MTRFLIVVITCFLAFPGFCGQNPAKIKVACLGNSVTYGYGIKDREQHAYPAQLQQLLGANYEVANFGLSGATLLKNGHRPYHKTQPYREALAFKPDIAVIHLGLNDTDPPQLASLPRRVCGRLL